MIKVGCVCRLGQDYPVSSYVCFCMCMSIDEVFLNSTAFGMGESVVRWPRGLGERQRKRDWIQITAHPVPIDVASAL